MTYTIKKRKSIKKEGFQSPIYQFQDSHQEQIIHSGWKKGNSYRFVLEGTGDVFRELAIKPNNPDKSYLMEKLGRIKRHFELMEKQKQYFPETQIHPEDSIQYAKQENPEKFKIMEEQWINQPVNTMGQEKARQLNLAMIRGDYLKAKVLIKEIEEEYHFN